MHVRITIIKARAVNWCILEKNYLLLGIIAYSQYCWGFRKNSILWSRFHRIRPLDPVFSKRFLERISIRKYGEIRRVKQTNRCRQPSFEVRGDLCRLSLVTIYADHANRHLNHFETERFRLIHWPIDRSLKPALDFCFFIQFRNDGRTPDVCTYRQD